jgi:hypothetical protein
MTHNKAPLGPTFAKSVIQFTHSLKPDWLLPAGVEVLFPYGSAATISALETFYTKYYNDELPRIYIFGINPGRFGAGITGVPFTDPIRLETICGIKNPFDKKAELSSVFVYQFIHAFGGPEAFYRQFYITSLSPLGFTKGGKNYNYYDDRQLENAVTPHIIDNIQTQKTFGTHNEVALCMGEGQNYRFFTRINDKHHFFDEILALPHPRWVMQYRLKKMDAYIDLYLQQFNKAIALIKAR